MAPPIPPQAVDDSEEDVEMKEIPSSTRRNPGYKRKKEEDIGDEVKKRKIVQTYDNEQDENNGIAEKDISDEVFQSLDIKRLKAGKPKKQQQTSYQRKTKTLSFIPIPTEESNYHYSIPTPKNTTIEPVEVQKVVMDKTKYVPQTKSNNYFSIISFLVAVIAILYIVYLQYITTISQANIEDLKSDNITNVETNQTEVFESLLDAHSRELKNNILNMIDSRLFDLERKLNNHLKQSISTQTATSKARQQQELDKMKQTLISKISTEVDSILSEKLKSINEVNEQSINDLKYKIDSIIPGVKNMIEESFDRYDADKIGLTDYALASLGTKIVEHSRTYNPSKFWPQLFTPGKTPDIILNSDTTIGNCWPMKGSSGFVVIEITHSIIPTSFSVDHVPKSLSPNISSAPKQISVFGYETSTTLTQLALFEYDVHGSATQTFNVEEVTNKKYSKFRFQIGGNYGNSFYTCIYRFRIHGESQNMMLN